LTDAYDAAIWRMNLKYFAGWHDYNVNRRGVRSN